MCRIATASLCLVAVLVLAPLPAYAQGKAKPKPKDVAAALAALEERVAKLEGNLTSADLVGTYRTAGFAIDLDGGTPASITVFAYGATATLEANGTGTIVQGGGTSGAIELVQGTPWTDDAQLIPEELPIVITWSYANGLLHLSDGTVNLDMDLVVGAGGRVLTWAGLGDDGEASIVIATRLE